MSHWNYRVMRMELDGEAWLQIHEVYYDADGKPISYTEEAIAATAEETETLEGLRVELQRMLLAIEKPVLLPSDFDAEEIGYIHAAVRGLGELLEGGSPTPEGRALFKSGFQP